MKLCDTHAHLSDRKLMHEREEVLHRARTAGVTGVIDVGSNLDTSDMAAEKALADEGIWATVGVHPHEADKLDGEAFRRLAQLAVRPGIVAIGEIGLDFYRDLSPRDRQREAFAEQLSLAHRLGLPVVVHSRDAHEEVVQTLARYEGAVKAVLHCFSADAEIMQRAIDVGCYISFAGNMTYPGAGDIREAAAVVPLERVMLETDCPYLAPVPRRGRRNEPAYIVHTADAFAAIREMTIEEVAEITYRNAEAFFGL